jgi:hypothetical protein
MLPRSSRLLLTLALLIITGCASPSAPVAEQPTAQPTPTSVASAPSEPAASASPIPPTIVPAEPAASASAAPSAAPTATAAPSPAPSNSQSAPPEIAEVAILELGGQLRLQRGDQQQSLADLPGDDYSNSDLVWSPDGWRLAAADGIRTFAAEGAAPKLSPLNGGGPRWSPDSQHLAWTIGIEEHTDGLIIAGPDGDQPTLAGSNHWGVVGLANWRPDGQVVVAGAVAATTDGSAPPTLPDSVGQDAAWAPDGRTLAWSVIEDDGLTITRTLTLWDGATTATIGALKLARSEATAMADWTTPGIDPPRLFWLPDGSGVLLPIPITNMNDGGTWLIQRDGAVRRVSEAVLTDLAPDGTRMLARTVDNRIVAVRVADGAIESDLGPGVVAAWRPAPTGAPPSAPLAEKSPTLALQSPRMQGEAVRDLQQRLAKLGFDAGPADGIFGPQTEQAVREFQEQQGLSVDGVVGPQTWAVLRGFEWSPPPTE